MVKETDLYDELGISPDATEPQIRSAYRRKALQYHPDKNSGDPAAAEKFKKVAEAYEILSDAERRKQYDTFGRNGLGSAAGGSGGVPGGGFGSSFGAGIDPMDIFSSFFGFASGGGPGASRQQRPAKPSFILVELQCSLEELYCGTVKVLQVRRRRLCPSCHGHGTSSGRPSPVCPQCKGNKTVTKALNFGGLTAYQQCRCDRCEGLGKLPIQSPCARCGPVYDAHQRSPLSGTHKPDPLPRGVVVEEKMIKVSIEPGTEDSDALHYVGQGDELPGFDAVGDVLVVIEQLPHPYYRRVNSTDLLLSNCRVPLGCLFRDAFSIPIELLDGRVVRLATPLRDGNVPHFLFDSQHVFVVDNEGMPLKERKRGGAAADANHNGSEAAEGVAHRKKGKLYLCIDVVFPSSLTPAQVDIITKALGSSHERDPAATGGDAGRVVTLQSHRGPAPSWYTVDAEGNAWYQPNALPTAKKKRKATSTAE
ncbi:J4 / DnaJ domain-containing protein / JDP4 [Leishmania donovani]|uniref:DnaJ_domain/DnaJ_central_domain_containing_protei n_putative/Pfam:PF00226/Pfam:PF00684 n=1 Tax=Leishmania donovani TaxID=5661 RepID=A0A6J8F6V4_LEIDO|nr:J4 / DnaJ domain-containing protein / JDP4 [Leishmania donovani]VDZ43435.1 DnaJ_domain/DnaJ_central_domain_containing_protein_putative/Pfam:PF00226/Pfam:PF00684 [Leishmania donovani]